jgi:hypothetical protein
MQDYDEALDHLSGRRRSSYFQENGFGVWGLQFLGAWIFRNQGFYACFFLPSADV